MSRALSLSRVDGRTVVITGGTGGIGLAAAAELTRLGADVVITGRDPQRSAAAADRIADLGGREPRVLIADLASLADVRRLATEIEAACPRLDVLVHNAGAVHRIAQHTVDDLEMTLAVNVVAPVLLTDLLESRLLASGSSRVVMVASSAHRFGRVDPDRMRRLRTLSGDRGLRGYRPSAAYSASKLADILIARALADRWRDRGPIAVSMHPGVVATGFGHNQGGLISGVLALARPYMRSPFQGADTIVACATAPAADLEPGAWYVTRRPRRAARRATDPRRAAALWDAALALGRGED